MRASCFSLFQRAKMPPAYIRRELKVMNTELARFNMIEQQIRPWDVLDQRVLDSLQVIPREAFVPPRYRQLAFADTAIPLAHGQSMMCPNLEGRLLQALAINESDRILEIGTGSAYLTACLARLAGSGEVESVDIYQDFIDEADLKLKQHELRNVKLATGDASKGWTENNQYDAIAITGALPEIPIAYKQALTPGGRLFAIVGRNSQPKMQAVMLTRGHGDQEQWLEEILFETVVPLLVNADSRMQFKF